MGLPGASSAFEGLILRFFDEIETQSQLAR